jgi:hypothetical protein
MIHCSRRATGEVVLETSSKGRSISYHVGDIFKEMVPFGRLGACLFLLGIAAWLTTRGRVTVSVPAYSRRTLWCTSTTVATTRSPWTPSSERSRSRPLPISCGYEPSIGHTPVEALPCDTDHDSPSHRGTLQTQSQKAEVNNLSLRDYMIKPIQRICKYPLLFKVGVHISPPHSPSHILTSIAYCLVRCLANTHTHTHTHNV